MAGAGFKDFTAGDILTAAQVDEYLMQQTVMRFANAAARTTALSGVLAEGMLSYLDDTNAVQVYNGSSWVNVGGSSPLTTKGDLYTYSTTDARLAVGANDTVLTADNSTATGLKWATVNAGGWTLLNTGGTSFSGASVTINSIPGTYQKLVLICQNFKPATDGASLHIRFNSDSNNRYGYVSQSSSAQSFVQSWIKIANDQDNASGSGITYTEIPNYANTVTWKSVMNYGFGNTYNDATKYDFEATWGIYNQTSAITSLTVLPNTGNFTSGTAYLYGVK
jgi:hypothetical protein